MGFCEKLVNVTSGLFVSVKANWNELTTLEILVHIWLRLISFSDAANAVSQASKLLHAARVTALLFARDMYSERHLMETATHVQDIQNRILKACFLCRLAYTKDTNMDVNDYFSTPHDLAAFVECGIMIKDSLPYDKAGLPHDLQQALMRDCMSTASLLDWQKYLAQVGNRGYIKGVTRILGSCAPKVFELLGERWIEITSHSTATVGQQVRYDLISGTLPADGKRLGTLPAAYTADSLYRDISASKILEVCASDLPGSQYKTVRAIQGNVVF